jgi:hypothetical protein
MRSISLVFSLMLLAVQMASCVNFYQYHGDDLLPVLCGGDAINARFCWMPWRGAAWTAPCLTAIFVAYSMARFKALGRKWWVFYLPAWVMLLTVFMAMTVPVVYT